MRWFFLLAAIFSGLAQAQFRFDKLGILGPCETETLVIQHVPLGPFEPDEATEQLLG